MKYILILISSLLIATAPALSLGGEVIVIIETVAFRPLEVDPALTTVVVNELVSPRHVEVTDDGELVAEADLSFEESLEVPADDSVESRVVTAEAL